MPAQDDQGIRRRKRRSKQLAYERQRDLLIADWVESSTTRRAIVLKRAVLEEFGIGGVVYTHRRHYDVLPDEVVAIRPVVRQMYEETQADLHAKGIKSVTLYRGVQSEVATQAVLEGWTSSRSVAQNYGSHKIVEEVIPATRVFACSRGPGWKNGPRGEEHEYIVMSEEPRR